MDHVIETTRGKITGIPGAQPGVTAYLGIPYASAERWGYPRQADAWEGVLCADRYGDICIQRGALEKTKGSDGDFYEHEFRDGIAYTYSLSCLNLNIWKPDNARNAPVLVYVHGGAFLGGSAQQHCFDGSALARKGLVVVTVNFRLGIFGGFAAPVLAGRDGHTGNYGMYDVLAALTWVHDEISAFGGDPGNVTLMGQSAGARMVQLLSLSPRTAGLVHRVVLSSGGGLAGLFGRELEIGEAGELWRTLLEKQGISDVASLERMSDNELEALLEQCAGSDFRACMTACAPAVDGLLLPKSIEELYSEKNVPDIPLIIGSNSQDVMAEDMFGAVLDWPPAHRRTAWQYHFERQLPGDDAGAFHSADLWYWFGALDRSWRPFTEWDRRLSEAMTDYLSSFARTGRPVCKQLPEWECCHSAGGKVMCFGDAEISMKHMTMI